jgi:hypothetical protein
MQNGPSRSLQVTFIVFGVANMIISVFAAAWILFPIGIFAILAAGIRTNIVTDPKYAQLSATTHLWGAQVYKKTFDTKNGMIEVVLIPAGTQDGDGISISDSATLYFVSAQKQKAILANSRDTNRLVTDGKVLAEVLGLEYRRSQK